MNNKKSLGWRARWAVLPTAVAILWAGTANAQNNPLKLGYFMEYTGGSSGTTSESVQLGADVAIKEINAAGGINGRKIVTVTADTQTNPTVSVGEAKRLVLQEKVDLIIGPVISQIQIAAAPVINDGNIASMGSTGSLAITPQTAPYYFSTLVSAAAQAQAVIAYAADVLKVKSGAILSDDSAQSKDFVEAMRKEAAARNIKLTGVQEYQYRATDMTPQLLALKRGSPDTLFLFSASGEDAGNALKSMDDLGWKPKVTGNWTLGTFIDVIEKNAGPDVLKGVTGLNYSGFTFCKGKTGGQPTGFLKFVTDAKALKPDLAPRASYTIAALFYDAVYLMKDAIEHNGGKTDGKSIAAWVEQNSSKFHGISGAIVASTASHFLYGANSLAVVYPSVRGEAGIEQRATGCD